MCSECRGEIGAHQDSRARLLRRTQQPDSRHADRAGGECLGANDRGEIEAGRATVARTLATLVVFGTTERMEPPVHGDPDDPSRDAKRQ